MRWTRASTTSTSCPGRLERLHRIDAEGFYSLFEGMVIDDTAVYNNQLQEFESLRS
ncbi:hypothetical protein [Streptomyces canus]|uniref:hypothetical protein n=1 Tax=Streptomyces canus TaxID=58343 RepID=UPI00224E8637|nr:hypothetical protein [Streptomyces canus]